MIAPIFYGEYAVLNYIDFVGSKQKICCNDVDELWEGGGKSETLNILGYITVYG